MLAFILLAVNLIFAPHNPYMEKNSAFECGFSSFLGQNRTQFSVSFFIFALLFLLFDLEILLVYPYLVSAYTNGVYGLAVMLMFLLALTLGFAFELGKKALFIDSRQMSNVPTKAKPSYISKVSANVSPSLHIGKRHYSSSSNKDNLIREMLIVSSRQILLALLPCLLVCSFLYLIIVYVLGLTCFIPCISFILISLLQLIHYTSNFYYISKARASSSTSIKPYSNNEFAQELFLEIGLYLCCLIDLVKLLVSLIMLPIGVLLATTVASKIKSALLSTLANTPYYRTLENAYYKMGLFYLLDMLALHIHYFMIRNVLNILCFCFFCIYGVYIDFIPFSLFIISVRTTVLFYSILYIYKSRYIFKNPVVF